MFESVDINSSVAVYVQIENQVQFAIAAGQLKEGDRLPSHSELSQKLGVNSNTVMKAYWDLKIMGVVDSRRGVGVVVNKGAAAKCASECRARIVGRINEVVAEAKASGMSGSEVKAICNASYASGASPYGEVPKAVLAFAKK